MLKVQDHHLALAAQAAAHRVVQVRADQVVPLVVVGVVQAVAVEVAP